MRGHAHNVRQFMKLSEVLQPDNVHLQVPVTTKAALLGYLAQTVADAQGLAKDDILNALQSREDLGSTGIGSGIAIPHASVSGLGDPYMLLIRTSKPVEFDSIDEQPVDLICLILTPAGEQNHYLTLLAKAARQLGSSDIVQKIRNAGTPLEMHTAITTCDR